MSLDFSGTWINDAGHRLMVAPDRKHGYFIRYEPTTRFDRFRVKLDVLMHLKFSGFPGWNEAERLLVHVYEPWGPDLYFSPIFDESTRVCALAPSIAPGPFLEYEEIRGLKWFDTSSAFIRRDGM
jgi:hypothetical protein